MLEAFSQNSALAPFHSSGDSMPPSLMVAALEANDPPSLRRHNLEPARAKPTAPVYDHKNPIRLELWGVHVECTLSALMGEDYETLQDNDPSLVEWAQLNKRDITGASPEKGQSKVDYLIFMQKRAGARRNAYNSLMRMDGVLSQRTLEFLNQNPAIRQQHDGRRRFPASARGGIRRSV